MIFILSYNYLLSRYWQFDPRLPPQTRGLESVPNGTKPLPKAHKSESGNGVKVGSAGHVKLKSSTSMISIALFFPPVRTDPPNIITLPAKDHIIT